MPGYWILSRHPKWQWKYVISLALESEVFRLNIIYLFLYLFYMYISGGHYWFISFLLIDGKRPPPPFHPPPHSPTVCRTHLSTSRIVRRSLDDLDQTMRQEIVGVFFACYTVQHPNFLRPKSYSSSAKIINARRISLFLVHVCLFSRT